jgi:hypothetical protein
MSNHPSKALTVKIINDAFYSAPQIQQGFRNSIIHDILFEECLTAERQHRKPCGRFNPPAPKGWSAQDAARYFTVKYLRSYVLRPESMPSLGQYLHIRHECFTAAAIVLEHGFKIGEWALTIAETFDSIDYARMMSWDFYAEREAKGQQ